MYPLREGIYHGYPPPVIIASKVYIGGIYYTSNEFASLAHSFYICLKLQLIHELYSSDLP